MSDNDSDTMTTTPTTDATPESSATTSEEWERERAGDVTCPRCGGLVCPRCADYFNREVRWSNALAYYLRIYEHAHTTGNSVPVSVEREARAALAGHTEMVVGGVASGTEGTSHAYPVDPQ